MVFIENHLISEEKRGKIKNNLWNLTCCIFIYSVHNFLVIFFLCNFSLTLFELFKNILFNFQICGNISYIFVTGFQLFYFVYKYFNFLKHLLIFFLKLVISVSKENKTLSDFVNVSISLSRSLWFYTLYFEEKKLTFDFF